MLKNISKPTREFTHKHVKDQRPSKLNIKFKLFMLMKMVI